MCVCEGSTRSMFQISRLWLVVFVCDRARSNGEHRSWCCRWHGEKVVCGNRRVNFPFYPPKPAYDLMKVKTFFVSRRQHADATRFLLWLGLCLCLLTEIRYAPSDEVEMRLCGENIRVEDESSDKFFPSF